MRQCVINTRTNVSDIYIRTHVCIIIPNSRHIHTNTCMYNHTEFKPCDPDSVTLTQNCSTVDAPDSARDQANQVQVSSFYSTTP